MRALLLLLLVLMLTYLGARFVPWSDLRALPGRVEVPSVAWLVTPTFTLRPSPTATTTRTPTRTRTPTFMPTVTAVSPTETRTAEPPTATAVPTLADTAMPPHLAPTLLLPEDGAAFSGGGSSILLTWESAGALEADEWYALSLRYLADGVVQYAGTWTKETAWGVPSELFMRAGQTERQFEWDVTVMLQTTTTSEGGRAGTPLGPTSETRTFVWR